MLPAYTPVNPPSSFILSRREFLRAGGLSGIGLIFPCVLSGCSSSQASVGYKAARQDALRIAAAVLAQGEVSALGIALTTADDLVWAETLGSADLQRRLPANSSTLFGVASVTSSITQNLLQRLVKKIR